MLDSFYIVDDRGCFYSNSGRFKYYNSSDFCDDPYYAVQFKTMDLAEKFMSHYTCYGIDGNTPVPLRIVRLNVVAA